MDLKKKILILEDELINQELLKLFFINKYVLIFAQTVEQALAEINKQVFDLILSDVKLSGLQDGLYFLKKAKASKLNATVPVIAYSSNSKSPNQKSYKEEGFDGFLSKPTNKTEAVASINRFLNLK